MNLHQLKITTNALRSQLKIYEQITPTCWHCEHFSSGSICDKVGLAPPAEFQRTPEACEDWLYDSVPF